ncbi:MAG: hypothetical protein ABUK01_12020 [Leptospirales bacterium]
MNNSPNCRLLGFQLSKGNRSILKNDKVKIMKHGLPKGVLNEIDKIETLQLVPVWEHSGSPGSDNRSYDIIPYLYSIMYTEKLSHPWGLDLKEFILQDQKVLILQWYPK